LFQSAVQDKTQAAVQDRARQTLHRTYLNHVMIRSLNLCLCIY